jgi:hypothetical protein
MSAPPIELVYFTGCPHVDAARESLRAALNAAGLPARWVEWDQTREATPERVHAYGSPTVLIGGVDVTGAAPTHGRSCRADGIPAVAVIVDALSPWRRP